MNLKVLLAVLIASIHCRQVPKVLQKINKALGLPKKSETLWDILSIVDINTKVEEIVIDIANNTNEITNLNERVDQLEECCDCTKPNYTKVMITAGDVNTTVSSVRKTEIVDVANGLTCSDLADFPVEYWGGVGANLGGTPVVCSLYKCYRFRNGAWEEIASIQEEGGLYAAGVMYDKKLHVFGGEGGRKLKTSFTINVDGEVSKGPDLPTRNSQFAMTTINDTVSVLSGGNTKADSASAKTWYYNHDTEIFTKGSDLLLGRNSHGSATIVDKVTKAKIAVVTGGYQASYGTLTSTEKLIDGHWETGPPLPKALYNFGMLEMHGDVYVFGGQRGTWANDYQSAIYQMSCSSGICSWTTLSQQLKVARGYPVAIPVQDNFCS